jgi:hypothetical protein
LSPLIPKKGFVMINIASIPPASWPTSSTAVSVAPVSAVAAVSPSSRLGQEESSAFGSGSGSGRQAPLAQDPQAGKGASRDASAEASKSAPKAAPILPEKAKAGESTSVAQAVENAKKAEQAARDDQAAEEQRATQREKLLEVLSTVWKASAAVVDNALGRGDRAAAQAGAAGVDAAPVEVPAAVRTSQGALDGASGPVPPEVALAGGSAPAFVQTDPPVSYTEHGVSQWGTLELGQLVSKRA